MWEYDIRSEIGSKLLTPNLNLIIRDTVRRLKENVDKLENLTGR